MKQVVQSVSGGPVRVIDVPRPTIGPTEVLVQTVASVISPGTERAVTSLARSSLLAKAKARPDLVRQVIKKAKTEGIAQTARAVKGRLGEDLPLGYSAAGIVLEVGEAVADVSTGQLVATGGAGKANHAEFQAVPGLLCATVPDGVASESAAFATIGSIALHGLRLAEVGPGAKVAVVGLGLVGQLSMRLASASGCDVVGIDVAEFPVAKAQGSGGFALLEEGEDTTKAILEWSRSRGCDAVLVTAGGADSTVIMRTPDISRDRAAIVVVGDVGLELQRRPFYEKELTLRFARSYGPGRYERAYEDWGVDYPAGHVRWTEGRNLEAVLDLIARSALQVDDLVTHTFPIERATEAYELIEKRAEPYLGVQLTYPATQPSAEPPIVIGPRRKTAAPSVGFIGAGSFASSVLVPSMKQAGFDRFVSVASASGLSAKRLADKAGFEKAVSGADAVIDDPEVDVVVIATPHDAHADLTERALRAGKHVFCEKPLALSMEELERVEQALTESDGVLFVGFNRRWSQPIAMVKEHFAKRTGPLVINYRVNAGPIPEGHWYNDRRQGGRLLGEVCHFIDTCSAILDDVKAVEMAAIQTVGDEKDDGYLVTLGFEDRASASIQYLPIAPKRSGKERVELSDSGHLAEIDDYHVVRLDGHAHKITPQDKGHGPQMNAFLHAIRAGETPRFVLSSSRTALRADLCLRQDGTRDFGD